MEETVSAATSATAAPQSDAPKPQDTAQVTAAVPAEPVAPPTTKEEPAEPESVEGPYVVDDAISDEELARSVKSLNDFSVELQRTRLLMQKRQLAQHRQ